MMKVRRITRLQTERLIEDYKNSQKRLLLFDYDGTLVPVFKFPELAFPDERLQKVLETLGKDKRNTLVIISGREMFALDQWLGDLPIHLVAEYGAFCKPAGKNPHALLTCDLEWKKPVSSLLEKYMEQCPGSFIEYKSMSVAWHFRNVEPEFARAQSKTLMEDLKALSSTFHFNIIEADKTIEVRSDQIAKGNAALNWLNAPDAAFDFILAIGDDKTDEDLFKVIPEEGHSIHVGNGPSCAMYNLPDRSSVISLLEVFSQLSKGEQIT